MDDNLPVVNMEVSSGTFRIKTQEAIYQITVTPDSSLTRVVEKVVEREAPAPGPGSATDDPFYRDMTEEMYSEIGRLARQLSLSIKEIPGQSFKGLDIQSAGVELEDAKGQLEDIVQMTEKATMDIMDLAESIQDELQDVQGRLTGIKELEFMSRGEGDVDPDLDWGEEPSAEDAAGDAGADPDQAAAALQTVIEHVTGLREAVAGLPRQEEPAGEPEPAPAAPEPVAPTIEKTYHFDTDVVFQTLYELCTNETVKDHIKAMRGEQETAFDTDAVQAALGEMAPNVDVEDNFFNFPIANILKSLFAAAKNEKHKQILKKMNQTAGNIFLDTVLPVEGEVQETETATPAQEPAPAPAQPAAAARPGLPPEQIDQLLEMIDENIGLLEAEREKLARSAEEGGMNALETAAGDPSFTRVKQDDREQIISTVEGASEMIQNITSHLTRILEALAFQDLSGQRILKIVRLISDVQVQLLSILVSFGAKMKRKKEAPEMAQITGDAHELAQSEVDKMLEQVGGSTLEGPEAEGRLDQGKVDDLLADLGF